ncbi:crotonase/enoyl-CoA hydratase family protein [Paremcibacter congregatus]|uniref:crotonase/enoyl-CoA hydratase family protein n=1 Tax=Paremcibacter congregatus TaxID=2043170 RepID=UPI0030ED3182|tara:strand:+ start:4021 stop:4836 length:816 start_codon:yes stop_codon:yes gene_type:complete
MDYQSLSLDIADHVAVVTLNKPEKINAMGADFWDECGEVFRQINDDPDVRVAIIASTGKHFTAGIDLGYLQSLLPLQDADPARAMDMMRRKIKYLQGAFEAIDNCRVPVLAAVQGGCFGAGVDLVSACDMRYASADAYFIIQEVNIGMVADVGTLQRMPRQIPDGLMRELAYTGRKYHADEAFATGYVTHVAEDHEALLAHVKQIAATIAAKSPLAVSGTKVMLNHTRDHGLQEGLDYIASWNAGMLSFQDVMKGATAALTKSTAAFDDLM